MIGKPEKLIQWLFNQDREKQFEIKEHKEKRSLNANAYAWALIGKIADAMRLSKDECYLLMLKRYGQSEIYIVSSEIPEKRVERVFGEGHYEDIGTEIRNGIGYTHYRVYTGSSKYDTHEMAVLIDGIVSEAEALGIETLPPDEIQRLTERWQA